MRIVVLFNLRSDADVGAYEAWAKASDIPAVNGLPSIERFTVHKATSLLGTDARPPYQYIEIIDVRDADQFGKDVTTDTMKRIAAEFQAFADNPTFVVTQPIGA